MSAVDGSRRGRTRQTRAAASTANRRTPARRRTTGRKPEAGAAAAIAWGEPVLRSTISTVHSGRLIYRGVDAVEFAASASLEDAAVLLWGADRALFATPHAWSRPTESVAREALFAVLARSAAASDPTLGRSEPLLHTEAARLVNVVADTVSGIAAAPAEPIHAQLARGWGVPDAADCLRRALVLLADHELNVSTFAARVTASSGASLAAAVLAGLAALSGPLHGSAGMGVGELVRAAKHGGATEAVRGRLGQGLPIPGFGHPLYAGLDPRAAALLATFAAPAPYADLQRAALETLGHAPNIDFALSAMTAHFGLPADAPFLLFALARSTGWIAHALEQGREGRLIRPRARYVGALP